jgi:hypothetical protein
MRGKPGEFPNTRVTCSEPIQRSSQFMVVSSAAGFGRGHMQRERVKIWAEEGLQPVRKLRICVMRGQLPVSRFRSGDRPEDPDSQQNHGPR